MHLYHGSHHIIEQPAFGKGGSHNDYGRCFYCTEQLSMAREWAVEADRDGYANVYDFDADGLSVLRLGSDSYCMLHWLAVLLENREFDAVGPLAIEAKAYLLANFLPPYRDADVIVGYRADDSYFSFAQDFINGAISYRHLRQAMHLGKLGQQVALKSKRSFERLRFIEVLPASSSEWFARKQARDQTARRAYRELTQQRRKHDDLFILQILNEEVMPGDPRLR